MIRSPGAGFALNNVSGDDPAATSSAIIACGRGGAGFLNDATNQNTVRIERNLIDGNAGTEPAGSHGGALYLFSNRLHDHRKSVHAEQSDRQWGAGLYVGAFTPGGQLTTAALNWNVYRNNRAGNAGGGFFCDDGASCTSYHEVYYANCGGNIYFDSGPEGAPTTAKFDHLTNVGALDVGCESPGPGVRIDNDNAEPNAYSFVNAIFWDNAPALDFAATCNSPCPSAQVTISYSLVQTEHLEGGMKVSFGDGIVAPQDPLFADPANGDFHLKSAAGRWTRSGYVQDDVTSPALAKGYPEGSLEENPERAGNRIELGAYGNSGEASYVR